MRLSFQGSKFGTKVTEPRALTTGVIEKWRHKKHGMVLVCAGLLRTIYLPKTNQPQETKPSHVTGGTNAQDQERVCWFYHVLALPISSMHVNVVTPLPLDPLALFFPAEPCFLRPSQVAFAFSLHFRFARGCSYLRSQRAPVLALSGREGGKER